MDNTLKSFTDVLDEEICDSQPISLPSSADSNNAYLVANITKENDLCAANRPNKGTGQRGVFRSTEEVDPKYRDVFTYPYFNLVQSKVIDDALYSDKSIVVCAPTGSGKTVIFEMAIVQLLMELEDKNYTEDFKIIYMAPVKALCTERLTEWYPKFTKYGLLCIEATGDTDVDFAQLKPYKIIITTPEKWDMLTRRWRDHRSLVEVIKLFLIDEVHILNDETRGPVLEAVVSRMKTIESSAQSVHRIEQLQNQLQGSAMTHKTAPSIRFVAVSATVSNPEDVASWLGTNGKPAVFHKFGDECRPVKLRRIVEGYPCPNGASIFKFDIILNYKLWPVIQKYHSGKPTLIFCNTRKSVGLTAETLAKELTINFNAEQKAKLTALASTIKNKKLQSLVMSGVGCHHAGLLYEERQIIERAFRNRDLPILITTTTLAMGVNLPAHLVIIKNTQQYVNGAYQEYSISTVLQMVGRAGRPQFDTEATAVIMTRFEDKGRYQALVGGCEPLQSYLHKRLPENLNSEAALGTVGDVAQCVEWLRSTFLYVRAARDPKKYLSLPPKSPQHLISKKIEELCVKAMNGLASSGLITMDEASYIESTEAGRLMSIFYLDVETMKQLMKIEGTETLERLLILICESHELSEMHLRMDERRSLNALNRNNTGTTIRFPMKGKISTRQMKLNCVIQAVLGCLPIPDPSLNQEAMKIIRIADRVCKCLVAYVTRPDLISRQPQFYSAVLNSIILAKCIVAHLWENSPFVSKQLKGIGPTFSTLLATAGKSNFMLLEESHPRDLERIMNKNAPAGNVIRKQVSLLPKYQLTIMPVDESTVTIQLVLLNQNLLSENMDQLTAGGSHKSYIVVGDSDNHILLLAAFKDSDLIRVFDGIITHEIRRKHNHEHKIFAHCISTTFVGVDVQSDYQFNDLNKFLGSHNTNIIEMPVKETVKKHTCITDTFKERKRKSTTKLDKPQSKEKKKRDNALFESFNCLKKTFETASKNLKENLNLSTNKQGLKKYNILPEIEKEIVGINEENEMNTFNNEIQIEDNDDDIIVDDIIDDDIIDDEKIDSILTEIENEMSKKKADSKRKSSLGLNSNKQINEALSSTLFRFQKNTISKTPVQSKINSYKIYGDTKKRKTMYTKSNYNFIGLLERNLDLCDDDDKNVTLNNNNGFSETIKSQISKYIQETEYNGKSSDMNIQLLIESPDKLTSNINKGSNETIVLDSDNEEALPSTQKVYPHYEVKEILDKQNIINTNVNHKGEMIGTTGQHNNKILSNRKNKQSPSNYHSTIQNNNRIISKLAPSHTTEESNQWNMNEISLNELCKPKKKLTNLYTHCDGINNLKTEKSVDHDIDFEAQLINSRNQIIQPEDPITQTDCDVIESDLEKNNITSKESINLSLIAYNNTHVCKNDELRRIYVQDNLTSIDTENETAKNNYLSLEPFVNTYSNINYKAVPDTRMDHFNKNSNLISGNNKNLPANTTTLECKIAGNTSYTSKLLHSSSNVNSNRIEYTSSISSNKCNKKSNDYIKNYSYSTTDIDVCTKQMPEYCVHIIKKIKMDLNITEIITTSQFSQNENSASDTKSIANIEEMEYDRDINRLNTDVTDIISTTQFCRSENSESDNENTAGIEAIEYDRDVNKLNAIEHTKQNTNLLKNSPFGNRDIQKSIIYYFKSNHENPYNNPNIEPVVNVTKKYDKNINKHTMKTIHTYLQNAPFNTLDNDMQKPGMCRFKNTHQDDLNLSPINPLTNDLNMATDKNVTNNISNEIKDVNADYNNNLKESSIKTRGENSYVKQKNESNKLKNILQKYSKILGKDTTTSETPVHLSTNKNITSRRPPVTKLIKPFKINNIHKMQTVLPETIINCNKQKLEYNNIPKFTKILDNEAILKKHVECLPCSNVDPVTESIPCQAGTDIDLEPIHIPIDIDLEPITDFNIDQSMFDPKTLLQCSIDTDCKEIIPPPIQFCDEDTSYSLNCSVAEDSNMEVNYKQCDESHNSDFSVENDQDFNGSIFEDNCITNLTPSIEIETWTLAEQDSWEDRYSSPSPAKSFTVMRKNTSNYCSNRSANTSTIAKSRQAKLGQFKFNQKSRLRTWK